MSKMFRLLVPTMILALAAAAWGPLNSGYSDFTQVREGGRRANQNGPAPQAPRPKPKPATPPPATDTPDNPPATSPSGGGLGGSNPSDTLYPFIVTLKDGRDIKCDVQDDGDHYNLVKKGGTIVVAKADVLSVQPTGNGPTTEPTSAPATAPSN